MNTIEIRKLTISQNYENDCFVIDGIPLHEYFTKWHKELDLGEIPKPLAQADDLAVTWTASFDNDGDARFMRWLLEKEKLNLPILSCPDDLDFSCIVIVAEVEKTENHVFWKRIGIVNHSIDKLEEAKEHGIVFVDTYTDEDWEKYVDAAFMQVESYEWREWISANWSEELFHRHINYTYPCYQDDRNIDWIYDCNWCFDRKQYDALVSDCDPRWCLDNSKSL
ncbi:MAG: hypothetical protein K6F71_15365 [Ruminococcus sp.]|uniref:hypothetical protein n=1 Tax=Ruminococcus sp. TaxID=41978 RepID=UPI0025FA2917|nr:hypothetical protein [Ruminococcus sp.]MCR5542186.1 hypothetical protein [Ruminococcus sp.]